jgi:DNA-binding XRE family transcriptional regulator
MTQTFLAQTLKVLSQAHLSHLEAGRKEPSLQLVVNISAFFKVTIDYLLNDDFPVEAIEYRASGSISTTTWMEAFSAHLRLLRKNHGLTQAQLSQKIGLKTQAHISLLETQRSEPSIDLVIQLSRFFAIPIDNLFIIDVEYYHP